MLIHNTRFITFQVTNDCCCKCNYCYQINKKKEYMNFETGQKLIDLLFQMWDENNSESLINQQVNTIIFDFIGGEPLMNIKVIDKICSYFIEQCCQRHHPWIFNWMITITSNGAYYFKPEVQKFIQKFRKYLNLNITLDGPQEIHDKNRLYHNNVGNFNDAYKAFLAEQQRNQTTTINTKITISKNNLTELNQIILFFVKNKVENINLNCIYEECWSKEDGSVYYYQLKAITDFLIKNNFPISLSIFNENFGQPKNSNDLITWCGATSHMLAVAPNGILYPCIRFMESSLGEEITSITLGDIENGFDLNSFKTLSKVNRKTKSTNECFNCSIASGCPDCSAWNYQQNKEINSRSTNICNITKAGSLANVYYWNKFYEQNHIDKKFKMYLPKEEALKFIDEDEYNMLYALQDDKKGNEI